MTVSLWWVRRDLRLSDNQALAAALAQTKTVVPVFILDPVLLTAPEAGAKRVAFLMAGLRQLDQDLRARGSRLIVRRGDPVQELISLMEETGAQTIWAEEDVWPYARRREARVAQALPLHLTSGLTVHLPTAVVKADGTPYTIFTPFSRAWKSRPLPSALSLLPAPERLPPLPEVLSLPVPSEPELTDAIPFAPGEAEAQRRLRQFVDGAGASIFQYAQGRDRLDLNGTSHLSPYLRFGMLSARQAVVGALNAIQAAPEEGSRRSAEIWLNELIWREFYMSILAHFPDVLEQSFRPEFRDMVWEDNETAFAAWCEGRTGYPLVDAAMRQLVQTGWMPNRARMIAASFLVKDLLVDWRWGERFFMQHLVDGDPAANNGGWQWVAGTGTDAAPYFRLLNPVLQSRRADPDGIYIRRWVPELDRVPTAYLHAPWEMPPDLQRTVGCRIGVDYPAPIVDHAWARERALAAFAQARQRARGDQIQRSKPGHPPLPP
ncbi:MAG: cryptochrome/photolyase family protein [Anaerolineae bacterium]